MKPLTLQEQSMKAWQDYKGGNISYWTMADDDPEAKFWREVWEKGYAKGMEDAINVVSNTPGDCNLSEELKRLKR